MGEGSLGKNLTKKTPHPIYVFGFLLWPSPHKGGEGALTNASDDQLAIVLKFFAMCSAPRSVTAMIALVGFTAPEVGNRLEPAT
jgi:hypothetical protein